MSQVCEVSLQILGAEGFCPVLDLLVSSAFL